MAMSATADFDRIHVHRDSRTSCRRDTPRLVIHGTFFASKPRGMGFREVSECAVRRKLRSDSAFLLGLASTLPPLAQLVPLFAESPSCANLLRTKKFLRRTRQSQRSMGKRANGAKTSGEREREREAIERPAAMTTST